MVRLSRRYLSLAVLLPLLSMLTASMLPAGQASTTQTIVPFNAGDTVDGIATYVTISGSPTEEAGQHENLEIRGTNVPSQPSIPVDSAPYHIHFVASDNGELTACIGGEGYDGDEKATIDVKVTSAPTLKFIPPSDLLRRMGELLKAHGLALPATKCIASRASNSAACAEFALKLAGVFPGEVGREAREFFRNVTIAACVVGIIGRNPSTCGPLALLAIQELLAPSLVE